MKLKIPIKKRKKKIIIEAYTEEDLEVWCEDEAGPYQAVPYPGYQWAKSGYPAKQPHEYIKGEPVRLLTLFHPKTGYVIGKGVKNSPNSVLHPWLKGELAGIVKKLPRKNKSKKEKYKSWNKWQEGLKMPFTLPEDLPDLKMLLVLDNLKGHKTPSFVLWLVEHGIMPLYTPLAGSWLNMAESIQNILKKRALSGEHPKKAEETIRWLESAVLSWNLRPTPFIWNGKRAERRKRKRLKLLKDSRAIADQARIKRYIHVE